MFLLERMASVHFGGRRSEIRVPTPLRTFNTTSIGRLMMVMVWIHGRHFHSTMRCHARQVGSLVSRSVVFLQLSSDGSRSCHGTTTSSDNPVCKRNLLPCRNLFISHFNNSNVKCEIGPKQMSKCRTEPKAMVTENFLWACQRKIEESDRGTLDVMSENEAKRNDAPVSETTRSPWKCTIRLYVK